MIRFLTLVLTILSVLSTQARPGDYFRFGLTVTDGESSYQPLYFNLTSDGDFFVKSFDAHMTNLNPAPSSKEHGEDFEETTHNFIVYSAVSADPEESAAHSMDESNIIPYVTVAPYDDQWHIDSNNV